ncbi:chemotaxis protein CheA [Nocardiopsis ansamitocini]|uniref:Chemotaxis protein CheA n=1 Tax=Nocardiopsis ansamitocini TaxID=1670832 RepID=A0A9W6P8L3_9ACTN|nr:chemotaxis protein CheA [Nocardiopsis ansamitocini]GLU49574.1 hypothetical protein Nans01_39250 [Nocardiopsis ansamitocini]
MLRRLTLPALLAAVLTVFMAAAPASAAEAPGVSEVASALKSSHIYVDDASAQDIPQAEIDAMASAAESAETPVYFVIVADGVFASETTSAAFLSELRDEVGEGTYALAAGGSKVLRSDVISEGDQRSIYNEWNRTANPVDGMVGVAGGADDAASSAQASGTFGLVLLGLLALAVVGGGFFIYNSKKKREAKAAQELLEIKQMATEDVVRLGEDIAQLDIDLSRVDDATRTDYTHAMDSYDRAKTQLDTIQRPEEIQEVTNSLEDGRYYMVATRARMQGEEVPDRRKPCFFNPQHGPSEQDVMWAPMGGAPRSVPACAACSHDVLSGAHPDVRMVEVDGQRRPYYDAGPAYAPYAGGYFGTDMMMGMFTGMMMGSMMGSMMGGGMMGAGMGGGYEGDMGGGDVGGGDFGGGDFGDFGGGGDFGGFGDF